VAVPDYGGGMCNPIELSARLRDELEAVPILETEPSEPPIEAEPESGRPEIEEVVSHA
jgi:hypothetical protein